jgi:hypothetical protein
MGLKDTASLALIPAAYKTSKIYSALPTDGDGDFTFSRSGNATRINKAGLVETMGTNIGRLNYDLTNGTPASCPSLLLEPARTNFIERSEEFDNSYWIKENLSIGTGIVSPMGDTDAQNVIENTSTSRHRIRAYISVTSGTTYTLSVWAKSTNRNLVINADALFNARSGFNLSTGVVADTTSGTATITAFPNGWYRCTVTGAATSTQSQFFYLQAQTGTTDADYTGDGSSTLSLFGAQLEAGSYPTSYIKNVDTSEGATRTVDFCFINSGLQNVLNTSEGTLFVDVEVPRASSTGSFERITLSDQNASTDRIIFDNYGGNWRALMLSSAGNVNRTIVSVTANQRIKVAIAYSATSLRISYDGNTATTTNGSYTPSTTLESFKFSNKDGGNKWQGKIYQAIYFDTALTNAELKQLTS